MLHAGRVVVIILHELFDGQRLAVVVITQEFGDFFLVIELHLVALARAQIMQVIANAPQIVEGRLEFLLLALGDHPLDHQILEAARLVFDAGDPDRGVQIPQPPLAFLEIGLQQINRTAVFLQAFLVFLDFLANEPLAVAVEQHLEHLGEVILV